jgi:hypothetical protein
MLEMYEWSQNKVQKNEQIFEIFKLFFFFYDIILYFLRQPKKNETTVL